MNKSLERAARALRETYGWKRPLEQTRSGQPSPILLCAAAVIFLVRLLWFSQVLEFIYRVRKAATDIPPTLIEAYLGLSLLTEVGVGLGTYAGLTRSPSVAAIVVLVCMLKILENISSNVYYLALRPMLVAKAPHSTYRSFLLASVGIVEVVLLFSLLWLFAGATDPSLDSFVTAVYFTSTTFFTVGYGDYKPIGELSKALAVGTMASGFIMFTVVLSRAVSILKPLPTDEPGADGGPTSR